MADELNKQFIRNPLGFFKNNLVLVSSFLNSFPTDEFGTTQGFFSLKSAQNGYERISPTEYHPISVVELNHYENALHRNHSTFHQNSSLIDIYWLRCKISQTIQVCLGSNNRFFFTIGLRQCLINPVLDHKRDILNLVGNKKKLRVGSVAEASLLVRTSLPHPLSKTDKECAVFYGIKNRFWPGWRFFSQGYQSRIPEARELKWAGIIGNIDYLRLYTNRKINPPFIHS